MEDNVAANGHASYEELQPETAAARLSEFVAKGEITQQNVDNVLAGFLGRHEREQKAIADMEKNLAESEKQKADEAAQALLVDLEQLYGPDAVDGKLAEIESGDVEAEKVLKEIDEYRVKKQEIENQVKVHRENKIKVRAEKAERAMGLLKRNPDSAGS
jgi:hypothetical protein